MLRDSVLSAIGNTPVVRLRKLAPAGGAQVVVKLEYYNPTGSYKDRMALAMIDGAESRGALRPGMRVLEYTGGSTGTSIASACASSPLRAARRSWSSSSTTTPPAPTKTAWPWP